MVTINACLLTQELEHAHHRTVFLMTALKTAFVQSNYYLPARPDWHYSRDYLLTKNLDEQVFLEFSGDPIMDSGSFVATTEA